jgi:hypothetical protein
VAFTGVGSILIGDSFGVAVGVGGGLGSGVEEGLGFGVGNCTSWGVVCVAGVELDFGNGVGSISEGGSLKGRVGASCARSETGRVSPAIIKV